MSIGISMIAVAESVTKNLHLMYHVKAFILHMACTGTKKCRGVCTKTACTEFMCLMLYVTYRT